MATGLGSTKEHAALTESVRGWAARTGVRAEARLAAEGHGKRPEFWPALAAQGFLGMALPESYGGSGASLLDLAVVVEALGYELTPGPHLGSMLAGLLIAGYGSPELSADLLPELAEGRVVVGVGVGPSRLSLADGRLTGTVDLILGGGQAGWLVVAAENLDSGRGEGAPNEDWYVVPASPQGGASPQPGVDPTRAIAPVQVDAVAGRSLAGLPTAKVGNRLALLLAAESAGLAAWCLDTAVSYAKVREQFGQPIGGFQAVKHRCADLLVQVELAQAAVWDAASAPEDELAVAVAALVATDAAVNCAKGAIQVLGGIGYTWEHDVHLYLKRAIANRALVGGASRWKRAAARMALDGAVRGRAVELPAEAAGYRTDVREFLATVEGLPAHEQRRRTADAGYLVVHWPKPYGRGAGAVEQIVVAQEFEAAGVARADLIIGNWALPPILASGTDPQRERFVRPTLYGEISWCQLFSEPGAGSDLASLQTKAAKVEGGWSLSGQKVWTSMAATADWAICLARTSSGAKRHDGITYFLLDMHSAGIEVRPLRELTGHALFNEVFLTDVFVTDDCVVGEVDGGWRLARTTLANERVSMSSATSFPSGISELLDAVRDSGQEHDVGVLERVGALVCLGQADAALGLRSTLAQLSGTDPGASSSVRKLVGMHLRQDASELVLELLGPEVLTDAEVPILRFLANRALTIAGGTSEVLRNVVGERVLGLPL